MLWTHHKKCQTWLKQNAIRPDTSLEEISNKMLSCKTQQEGKQFRKNAANSTAINSIWWPYLAKSKTEKVFVPLLPIVYIFYGIWSQFIEIATLAPTPYCCWEYCWHHFALDISYFFQSWPFRPTTECKGRQAFILCCNDWLFSAF